MNNKKRGTAFEKKVCGMLAKAGCWVHFLSPNEAGTQPFDIIAVKNDVAIAVECKTLSTSKRYFSIDRLEENQKLAFAKWRECGNKAILIFVEYGDEVKVIEYDDLLQSLVIDMRGE